MLSGDNPGAFSDGQYSLDLQKRCEQRWAARFSRPAKPVATQKHPIERQDDQMRKRSEPWSAPPPSSEQLARTNRLRLAVGERAEVLEEAAKKDNCHPREHGTPSGIKTGQGSGSRSDRSLYGKSTRKGQTEEAIQIGGSPTLQVFVVWAVANARQKPRPS